ncbi:MAG: hypothetical protein JWO40_263 [Candidatus Doudnabacteria bacterium]|nr:hypothetical protein [Candidatus Doudnabacteria bacterium]
MKTTKKLSILAISLFVLVGSLSLSSPALAATPMLNIAQPDTNNIVRISVNNADPNSVLSLNQQQGNGPTIYTTNFGQTDNSGNFSQLFTLSTDHSSTPIQISAIVNGQRSNTIFVTPYSSYSYNNGNNGYNNNNNYNYNNSFTLGQNNVSVNAGQTVSVSIVNGYNNNYSYNNTYYVSSNSNNSVATITVSGNSLNVYGISAGTTTASICQNSGAVGCVSLFVTVSGNNYYNNNSQITFSSTNPTVGIGQTTAVTLFSNSYNNSYNNGSYYISSNSNSNAVSAYISGSTLNLTGVTTGTSSITVCQNSNGTQCATLFVTANGNYYNNNNYNNNGSLTFSPSSVSVIAGQTSLVTIYSNYSGYNNGYSNYTVSSNSNPNVATVTVSGNALNVYGVNAGSTTVSVCQTTNYQCNSLYISVTGYTNNYNNNYNNGNGNVLGASLFSNGTLVSDNGTIYETYKNTKSGFANYAAFTGLGFSLSNVVNASTNGLTFSNYIITTPYTSHPWGTWVKNGNTVYFADQFGLIPISDYNVFLNNGGNSNNVVAANNYDMQRPLEQVMTLNDARLR